MKDLLVAMTEDSGIELAELRVDGGASVSNIMMQIQADLLDKELLKPTCVETTAMGAAMLAGLACGFFKNLDEIKDKQSVERVFTPKMNQEEQEKLYRGWKKAVKATMAFAEE